MCLFPLTYMKIPFDPCAPSLFHYMSVSAVALSVTSSHSQMSGATQSEPALLFSVFFALLHLVLDPKAWDEAGFSRVHLSPAGAERHFHLST